MKRKLYLLFALSGLLFWGCELMDCMVPQSIFLVRGDGNLTQNEAQVFITSSVSWIVVSHPEWVTVTPDQGVGHPDPACIDLTGDINDTGYYRGDYVVIHGSDGSVLKILVYQNVWPIQPILQRLRELAVQAANDTNFDSDRENIIKEAVFLTGVIIVMNNEMKAEDIPDAFDPLDAKFADLLSAWENADTSTAVDFIALFDLIDELITNKHIEADFPFNPIPPFCLLWNLLLNGIVTTLWDSSYDVKYGLDHLYII